MWGQNDQINKSITNPDRISLKKRRTGVLTYNDVICFVFKKIFSIYLDTFKIYFLIFWWDIHERRCGRMFYYETAHTWIDTGLKWCSSTHTHIHTSVMYIHFPMYVKNNNNNLCTYMCMNLSSFSWIFSF